MNVDGVSASRAGLQTSAQSAALTANNVANLSSSGYRAERLAQSDRAQGGVAGVAVQQSPQPPVPGGSNVDLGAEAVNLDGQSLSYQADLKSLKSQDDMLGTALDMKA